MTYPTTNDNPPLGKKRMAKAHLDDRPEVVSHAYADRPRDPVIGVDQHTAERQQRLVASQPRYLDGRPVRRVREEAMAEAISRALVFAEAHQHGADPDLTADQYVAGLVRVAVQGYSDSLLGSDRADVVGVSR